MNRYRVNNGLMTTAPFHADNVEDAVRWAKENTLFRSNHAHLVKAWLEIWRDGDWLAATAHG